jgi:hypothetical protein
VVTGGFIELSATGVGARLELFARPKVSGAFEIALFPLPILGFAIPGIGKAGAVFEPRIAFDFEISGGFELNYGIDVTVSIASSHHFYKTDMHRSLITPTSDSPSQTSLTAALTASLNQRSLHSPSKPTSPTSKSCSVSPSSPPSL